MCESEVNPKKLLDRCYDRRSVKNLVKVFLIQTFCIRFTYEDIITGFFHLSTPKGLEKSNDETVAKACLPVGIRNTLI